MTTTKFGVNIEVSTVNAQAAPGKMCLLNVLTKHTKNVLNLCANSDVSGETTQIRRFVETLAFGTRCL